MTRERAPKANARSTLPHRAPAKAAGGGPARALPRTESLSALQALTVESPAVRALQRLAAASAARVQPAPRGQVLQLQEAWRGALYGEADDIWRSVDKFLANYMLVEEGELDPEVGFPHAAREANEDEEHDTAPLLKPVPDRLDAIRTIAKQVALDCVARFKTPEGRREIAANVGTGGLAGYIEAEILENIRPYLQKSVKSLMPWGSARKTRQTLMGLTEGVIDVVYNACGFGVEAMSAAAATPAVAAGGAAYKSSFAASGVRRAGGTKEQAAATATVTGFAEFGQGMIPFAGGGFGIASGLKGAADSSRIGARIRNILDGVGGGADTMAARSETVGDPRIFRVLESRGDYLVDLIEAARGCADAGTKANRKRLEALAQAQKWLNRQGRKARERFEKQEAKGNVPLLSRMDGDSGDYSEFG